jgi:hypothetical protein
MSKLMIYSFRNFNEKIQSLFHSIKTKIVSIILLSDDYLCIEGSNISILGSPTRDMYGIFIETPSTIFFQISKLIKIYQGRQSSCPLLAKLKVLPGSLTDLSA